MKNNVYPCKPQFYYIKVGFKGIKIILACFRDDMSEDTFSNVAVQIFYAILKINRNSNGGSNDS